MDDGGSETNGGGVQAEARAVGTAGVVHRRVVPCFLFFSQFFFFFLSIFLFLSIFFPFQFPSTISSNAAERVLHLVFSYS